MARKLKWETSAWSEDSSAASRIMTVGVGGAHDYIALVSPQAVEESTNDGIWVERIVGQVYHVVRAPGEPPQVNIKERVSVGFSRDQNISDPGNVSRPWPAAETVDNFLWERTQIVDGSVPNNGNGELFSVQGGVPFWTVIDIRVGRMLRPTRFLAYTIQTDPASVGAGIEVHTWGWLRCLISE